MQTEHIIGVREFLKNFSKISEEIELGKDFLVLRNSKPVCKVVSPYQKSKLLGKKVKKLKDKKLKFSDFVGILKVKNKEDFDYKEEVTKSLEEKYLN